MLASERLLEIEEAFARKENIQPSLETCLEDVMTVILDES